MCVCVCVCVCVKEQHVFSRSEPIAALVRGGSGLTLRFGACTKPMLLCFLDLVARQPVLLLPNIMWNIVRSCASVCLLTWVRVGRWAEASSRWP